MQKSCASSTWERLKNISKISKTRKRTKLQWEACSLFSSLKSALEWNLALILLSLKSQLLTQCARGAWNKLKLMNKRSMMPNLKANYHVSGKMKMRKMMNKVTSVFLAQNSTSFPEMESPGEHSTSL
jgi:hypothetical protein